MKSGLQTPIDDIALIWRIDTTFPLPDPPSQPRGGFALAFVVTEPAQAPDGAPVLYEYHWTSDGGDQAIHSPKFDRTDVLVETELLDPGETWTIAVTPFAGGVGGTIYWSQAKIGDMST